MLSMRISPAMDGSRQTWMFRRVPSITLPSPPYAPWLRLAHVFGCNEVTGSGGGTRRRLRDYCFLLQLSGDSFVSFADEGGSWPLRPGDLALIPPGHEYAWGLVPGSHLAVHFDLQAQPDLDASRMIEYLAGEVAPLPLPHEPRHRLVLGSGRPLACRWVVPTPSPGLWRARFAPLLGMWSRRDHHLPINRLLAASILAEAAHAWLQLATDATRHPADVPIAELIEALGAQPIADHLDITKLARRCRLGETAFRAAFARVAGMPPRAWLERQRIEHAAGLLRETSVSITKAAVAVGYPDAFHFSRVFRRVMGQSPRAWRQSLRPS